MPAWRSGYAGCSEGWRPRGLPRPVRWLVYQRQLRGGPAPAEQGALDVPHVTITEKLGRDDAARREVLPSVEHRQHPYLNNQAENSHQPTRKRERRMRRFKSPGHAQRFLAASGPIAGHRRPRRRRRTAADYRQTRVGRFASWRAVTGALAMA